MTQQHTPEPWTTQDDYLNLFAHSDGTTGLTIHIARFNHQQVEGRANEALANLRRVKACVNACKDIPNEVLESGTVQAVLEQAANLIREMAAKKLK